VLSSGLARGDEPSERIVRAGFVEPESPTSRRGVNAFWERLRG
jgi:hypothetical protein